ncbi:RraA-like protein [Rhizoctonia solani]|uniref:RraA-like protein n=1 Tax=Rhizoctonia solani TaxID=456999 RepID=A0A8H7LR61_9AGAM|nr:RraA-like protein [Rhizoctonia solani]
MRPPVGHWISIGVIQQTSTQYLIANIGEAYKFEMSDPSSFDIHVWNASRPNQATRTRPNTRAPNTFRVSRQDPDPNPSLLPSTSHFMTTTWSPPPPTTPPAQPSRAPSISRSYSDQNAHSTETVSSSSYMMLLRELEQFSSSEITNALVSLGLSHRAMDAHVQRGGRLPDIHMLSPWPNDRSGQYMRICGYAYTIKIVPAATAYPPIVSILPQAIDAAPMGSIIVVSVPLNMNTAVWDNNMTVHAKSRGIRGAIIGGRTKDIVHHRAAGFPVFAQGNQETAFGQAGFVHPVETSGPIIVFPRTDLEDCFENGLSALKIHPGDIIVADRDGVACIPPELSRRVFEICRYTRQMNEGQAGGM